MKRMHGTSQYRLNALKSHAQVFVENAQRIEMMWQMSDQGLVDKELANNYIKMMIDETTRNLEYFQGYLTYREDMQ